MELRNLGKSDVKVTPIAFGAWAIGGWLWGGAEEKDAIRALKVSYDVGITTIDTAPVYGFGRSEEIVGKAMEGIRRDSYQILTKYGLNWETHEGEFHFDSVDNGGNPVKIYKFSSRDKVIRECEDSLRRLKTDYVDLLQIHWPDGTTPISETMEAVATLIQQGKVRAAGVCNYNAEQVEEAFKTLALASNQVPYSMVRRDIEKDIVPQALEKGMSILPYSPLQRGLLTGKFSPGHVFKGGDNRGATKYFQPENIRRVNAMLEKFKTLAADHGATVSQLVIHWTIQQPAMNCVLVGARDEAQVMDNVKALSFKLSPEELSFMRQEIENLELEG